MYEANIRINLACLYCSKNRHQQGIDMLQPQAHSKRTHVLLIEDSRVDAAIVKAMLTEQGDIEVATTSTFQDALTALHKEKYDAIVLDLGLPDSTGAESIIALKKQFPHIPVLIVSGHEQEVAILRSLRYGGDEFLTKEQIDKGNIRHSVYGAIFRKSLRKKA